MNIKLRIIDNQHIPVLPSLTNDLSENLTTDVKLDVLTLQEVDINFANIIKYLKTVSEKIIEHSGVLGGLNAETLEELIKAAEQIKNISKKIESINEEIVNTKSDLEAFKIQTNDSLSRKIENVKTVNGVDINGVGNAEININRTQFVNHLTDISVNEMGSIAILECKTNIIFNNQYSGQMLFNDVFQTMQGVWRCIGVLESKKGLFIRVA